MKRKLMYTALVATVMGVGSPVRAEWDEPLYYYHHYESGSGEVGRSRDECRSWGVQNVWLWGYGTNDVVAIQWAICRDGQVVPIE
jgi:hypothetical protein